MQRGYVNLKLSLAIWISALMDFCTETNFLPVLPIKRAEQESVMLLESKTEDDCLISLVHILTGVMLMMAPRGADKREELIMVVLAPRATDE